VPFSLFFSDARIRRMLTDESMKLTAVSTDRAVHELSIYSCRGHIYACFAAEEESPLCGAIMDSLNLDLHWVSHT
jgi:hypothetical protein